MRIESLVRYPVKGLGPDYVATTIVEAGGALPFDREFAIAHAATEFDSRRPVYLEKHHFLMLMRDPQLAALKTTFDEKRRSIDVEFPDATCISCALDDPSTHGALIDALADMIGDRVRGGSPRIVSAKNHRFFDAKEDYLSLINLASVADLARAVEFELDPIRFRANICVTNLPAWQETQLVGRELSCGDVRFNVAGPIKRCAATSVNPDTGDVDVNVPFSLRKCFDTLEMGLYLEVRDGGTLETGMDIEVSK